MPKNSDVQNNHSILKYIVKKPKKIEDGLQKKNNNVFDFVKNKMSEKTKIQKVFNNEGSMCDETKKLKNELQIEKEKNKKLQSDLGASVSLLKSASSINLQKDIFIKKLSKDKNVTKDGEKSNNLFLEFNGHFNNDQLRQLRSIPSGKSRDSSFVLTLMRFLYPNTNVLSKKSATGKARNKMTKEKLTPHKKNLISDMLKERVSSENGLDDLTILQRMDNVNKLIKNAIENIVGKKSRTKSSTNKGEGDQNTTSSHAITGFETQNNQNDGHFNPIFGMIFPILMLTDF